MTRFMLEASHDMSSGAAPADATEMGRSQRASFRRLLEAAWLAGGDMSATARRLGIGYRLLGQRISMFKKAGLARTVTLMVLGGQGQAALSRAYVCLRAPRAADLADFEAFLRADPAVKTAAFVSGRHPYQLTTFHLGESELKSWVSMLERDFPGIEIVMKDLRACFGHEMAGVPLVPPPWSQAGLHHELDDVAGGEMVRVSRARPHPSAAAELGVP